MSQQLTCVALLVRDYDEAIAYFTEKLGFDVVEDRTTGEPGGKRWVLVAPKGARETRILLARASGPEQLAQVGNQGAGRVFLFLTTDDFARDYESYLRRGVDFIETPRKESYGTVAVFKDFLGNKWDLIEPKSLPR